MATSATMATSVFSSLTAMSVHQWSTGHFFEPADGRVIRRELVDVAHLVFQNRPEIRDHGEKVDATGLIARDRGLERQPGLRQHRVPVHPRKTARSRGRLVVLLNPRLQTEASAVVGAAGLLGGAELLCNRRRPARSLERNLHVESELVHR